jgi:uncharacterized membrane protein YhhN
MAEALAVTAALLVAPLLCAEHRSHRLRGLVKAAASSAFVAAVVGRWLWPELPAGMAGAVAAYIVVITVMVAAAAGAAGAEAPLLVLPAAVAFYVSDLFVARDRFVAPGISNRLWGLPPYYGAQISFALSTGMV